MTYHFDDTKDFAANLDGFLNYMEQQDPEMGSILRKHISALTTAADDSQRRGARALFNLGVKSSIDENLKGLLEMDGKE